MSRESRSRSLGSSEWRFSSRSVSISDFTSEVRSSMYARNSSVFALSSSSESEASPS